MKYGVRINNHKDITWCSCKAKAESIFNGYYDAVLFIGTDSDHLAYRFKANNYEIDEYIYAQENGCSDGNFIAVVEDKQGNVLYHSTIEGRGKCSDILVAISEALTASKVEHSYMCIDETLQLETW